MVNLFFVFLIIIGGVLGYQSFNEYFPEWQRLMGFTEAHSPVLERINTLHGDMMWMVFGVPIFVIGVMIYCGIRFSRKNNPKPAKFTHNTLIEVIWTTIPVIILIIIAIPSIKLLYYMDKAVNADMTLKVVGYQWYWGYEYPDHDNISFDSVIIREKDLKEGQIRLLETDNRVVLPVDTDIRLLFTSADVIHAWALPTLGVKMDAVPGRLNESWVRINKVGVYRGQCSELCGRDHGYMPIVIQAVSKEDFKKWVEKAKEEFAGDFKPLTIASN